MTKLLLYPSHGVISEELDTDFLWALDQELSFDVQGAKYTSSFRGFTARDGKFVKWDGKHRLLTDDLKFPLGLLARIQTFYAKFDKYPELQDLRPIKSAAAKINILPQLEALGKFPYPYQSQVIEAVKQQDQGIIRLATGGGKTLVSSLMVAELGKSALIYVIGKDLLYQLHYFFSSVFGQEIGMVGDGICQIKDINIVSVWTLGQALGFNNKQPAAEQDDEVHLDPEKYKDIRQMLSTAKVHIIDECHVAACRTIQEIARHINPEHIYGMSASPWRDDNADLLIESILGKYIVNISASTLIEQGYLVRPVIKFLPIPSLSGQSKLHYKTVYANYIVNNEIRNARINRAAERLVEQGYKTLVLYNTLAHGELLYSQLSSKLPCILLNGKDDNLKRQAAKESLEEGKINCILASKIFDIGVDIPCLSGLVLAGSGKSSVRALQRIGRVIRKFPGKQQAAVVDFFDQAPYLRDHARARRKIYCSEDKFEVIWPT